MKEESVYGHKEIMDLVSEGYDAYKIKVARRICNEHKHELELNLCPNCTKIARRRGRCNAVFVFMTGIKNYNDE